MDRTDRSGSRRTRHARGYRVRWGRRVLGLAAVCVVAMVGARSEVRTAAHTVEGWLRTNGGGSAPSAAPQEWVWRPAAAFGGPPTAFSTAFTIGDKGYVATGYGARNEVWQYDPGRDAWTRKANHPGKIRGAAVAFAIGGKGYLGTGFGDDERFADLWEYDPAADRWTQKASLPGAVRDHCAVFAIGSKAYVSSGMTCKANEQDCGELKEVWEYEPQADRWTRKRDMPQEIVWAAYFVLGGKGYMAGGPPRQQKVARDFWEYDPQADTWARKAEFPGRYRFRGVGFALDGKGYVATGAGAMSRTTGEVLNDLWEYDAQANTWTERPAFGGPARGAAVGFVIGGRVYIGTGSTASRDSLRDFWWADPSGTRAKGR